MTCDIMVRTIGTNLRYDMRSNQLGLLTNTGNTLSKITKENSKNFGWRETDFRIIGAKTCPEKQTGYFSLRLNTEHF
jgi:hypothetical protein